MDYEYAIRESLEDLADRGVPIILDTNVMHLQSTSKKIIGGQKHLERIIRMCDFIESIGGYYVTEEIEGENHEFINGLRNTVKAKKKFVQGRIIKRGGRNASPNEYQKSNQRKIEAREEREILERITMAYKRLHSLGICIEEEIGPFEPRHIDWIANDLRHAQWEVYGHLDWFIDRMNNEKKEHFQYDEKTIVKAILFSRKYPLGLVTRDTDFPRILKLINRGMVPSVKDIPKDFQLYCYNTKRCLFEEFYD
jgi:hypothetical protein